MMNLLMERLKAGIIGAVIGAAIMLAAMWASQ